MNFFNVNMSGKNDLPVSVTVRDIFGRQMQRNQKVAAGSIVKFGHNWGGGTYFVEVIQGTERVLLKVIKAN